MKFEGIKNLRDLGGIRTADGRTVKPGLIFRSASLFKATTEDMKRLVDDLRIREIIDLRTGLEKREKPDASAEGLYNLHIPIFAEAAIGITHETGSDYSSFIRHSHDRKAILNIVPDMKRIYAEVVLDEDIVKQMGEAVRHIIDNVLSGKSTLFHCSEGKDRAGAIAAFTLSLLGVSEKDILRDYAATNKVVKAKAFLNSVLVAVFKMHPKAAARVWRASIADPAYLKNSFEVVKAHYGSVERFIREFMGIPDDLRDQFRSRALSI